jgi:hypothetical protein
MKNSRQRFWVQLGVLLAVAAIIKICSLFGGWVEAAYSTGIYPVISIVLRAVTGWLPLSIGDILYVVVIIWLAVRIVQLVKIVIQRNANWQGFWLGLGKTVKRILWIYIIFYGFWGLNYSRYGISYQLKLIQQRYTTNDLKHITSILAEKVNAERKALGDSSFTYPPSKQIFSMAGDAYDSVSLQYPFLKYKCRSAKISLYALLDNYFGFLGYYNPFTGEAQINTSVPPFVVPYTACHEIAHQVGYGSESEANFVGYLAAKASNNTILKYSAYADLFSYANSELFMRDSAAARANFRGLDTLVKQDYRRYRKFLLSYKNPVEPIIRLFYGEYLKANNQPKGIDTYNEVVAWLIAYEKKFGKI